jgi:hypothetical protein
MSNLPTLFTLYPFLYDGFYKAYFEIKDSSFENLPELAKSAYRKLEKWAENLTESKKIAIPDLTEMEMNYINIDWIRKQFIKNMLTHCIKTNSVLFFDYILTNIKQTQYQYASAFIHTLKECKFDFATKLLNKIDETYLNVINLMVYINYSDQSIKFLEENKLHILDVTQNRLVNIILFNDKKIDIVDKYLTRFTKSKEVIYRSDNLQLFQQYLEDGTYKNRIMMEIIELIVYDREDIKSSKIVEYIIKNYYAAYKHIFINMILKRLNKHYINYNNVNYLSSLMEAKDSESFIGTIIKCTEDPSHDQIKVSENLDQLYKLYEKNKDKNYDSLIYHLSYSRLDADIIYLYENKEEFKNEKYINDLFDDYDFQNISDDMLKWFIKNGASDDSIQNTFIENLCIDKYGCKSMKKFIPYVPHLLKNGLKSAINENAYENTVLLLAAIKFKPKFINELINEIIERHKSFDESIDDSIPILVYLCRLFE